MSVRNDAQRTDNLHTDCKAIAFRAMLSVQKLCGGNETQFQYAMSLVILQMTEHLGLSLTPRKPREERDETV
jgi:hypothetical protein